jgi:hypothetical protein
MKQKFTLIQRGYRLVEARQHSFLHSNNEFRTAISSRSGTSRRLNNKVTAITARLLHDDGALRTSLARPRLLGHGSPLTASTVARDQVASSTSIRRALASKRKGWQTSRPALAKSGIVPHFDGRRRNVGKSLQQPR